MHCLKNLLIFDNIFSDVCYSLECTTIATPLYNSKSLENDIYSELKKFWFEKSLEFFIGYRAHLGCWLDLFIYEIYGIINTFVDDNVPL